MSVEATDPGGPTLGVAMIGYAFMGAAHSQGRRVLDAVERSSAGNAAWAKV